MERIKENSRVYIYFIDQKAHVKIGISRKPYKRMAKFQTGNPERLNMLGIVACPNLEVAQEIEAEFHTLFGHLRIGGEWFDFSDSAHPYRPAVLWLHHIEVFIRIMETLAESWRNEIEPPPFRHRFGRSPFPQGTDPMLLYLQNERENGS